MSRINSTASAFNQLRQCGPIVAEPTAMQNSTFSSQVLSRRDGQAELVWVATQANSAWPSLRESYGYVAIWFTARRLRLPIQLLTGLNVEQLRLIETNTLRL